MSWNWIKARFDSSNMETCDYATFQFNFGFLAFIQKNETKMFCLEGFSSHVFSLQKWEFSLFFFRKCFLNFNSSKFHFWNDNANTVKLVYIGNDNNWSLTLRTLELPQGKKGINIVIPRLGVDLYWAMNCYDLWLCSLCWTFCYL